MVICLEQSANDLHMVQLMPLPPHHVCFRKSRMVYPSGTGLKVKVKVTICKARSANASNALRYGSHSVTNQTIINFIKDTHFYHQL